MVFPVVMYGCESWTVRRLSSKNWCFWTVVLEKSLESPLDCEEILPVHPKGDQSWVFIGRTDVEAETPLLWPLHVKSWLIGKDHDSGKDWRQEEKGTTEDEMFGWHHRLNGHEFEQALGVGDGQGSLGAAVHRVCKEVHTTEQLNWTVPIQSYNSVIDQIPCLVRYTHLAYLFYNWRFVPLTPITYFSPPHPLPFGNQQLFVVSFHFVLFILFTRFHM